METTKNTDQQALKEMISYLVDTCPDEDLLDLIYRILAQSASTVLPG